MKYFDANTFQSLANRLEIDISYSRYVHGDKLWRMFQTVCSPYSRMYFFESGRAMLWVDGEEIDLLPGNVYIVPAGLSFTGGCDDKFSKVFFHFNIKKTDGTDLFSGVNKVLSAEIGVGKVNEIKKLFFSDNIVDVLKLKNEILSTALALLPSEKAQNMVLSEYSPLVQKAVDYIKANPSIKLSAKQLSDEFFVTRTTLSRRFADEVGVNIGKYIDDVVFENARIMLIRTDKSIDEISSKFGFCDRFYFSRQFKEKFGVTPSQYRKPN